MKCPYCNHDIPALWQELCATTNDRGITLEEATNGITVYLGMRDADSGSLRRLGRSFTARLFWMKCPNELCNELLVVVRSGYHKAGVSLRLDEASEWYAVPKRRSPRPIADEVPEPFRTDYIEAAMILDDSPRMSAVLSRRILTDVLAQYANLRGYKLSAQTEKFV